MLKTEWKQALFSSHNHLNYTTTLLKKLIRHVGQWKLQCWAYAQKNIVLEWIEWASQIFIKCCASCSFYIDKKWSFDKEELLIKLSSGVYNVEWIILVLDFLCCIVWYIRYVLILVLDNIHDKKLLFLLFFKFITFSIQSVNSIEAVWLDVCRDIFNPYSNII
jgi:hypothetical protein